MKPLRILGIGLACACLAACDDTTEAAPPPQQVRAISAASAQYQPIAEITGEVKARIQTELSFRVSGRVIERRVDVGAHVRAGEVLARLNDTEQQADVSVARAALESARAVVKQRTLAFERAKGLVQLQVISQETFDEARKDLTSAQASLEAAAAGLATAEDALSYTELKAEVDGIVTARSLEVGQVVSAAQSVLTLAHDGSRDVVFDVFEAFFLGGPPLTDVAVAPVGDRAQEVKGKIREVSPVIDTKAGTIRIKVALPEAARWPLGTPVVGKLRSAPADGIVLPYSAMTSARGEPAVWLVNSDNSSVSLRKVSVARYRRSDFVVTNGLSPNDLVVSEGGKFLREGQAVAWEGK